jgi:hypothetical protein
LKLSVGDMNRLSGKLRGFQATLAAFEQAKDEMGRIAFENDIRSRHERLVTQNEQ